MHPARFMRRALLLAAAALLCSAETTFHLKHGDRVVFFGDSITEQRLYTTFVESFAVLRYPQLTVDFVHSGWGGDRVSGGGGGPVDVRLWRDVFAHRPTVVTVMLGMNDGRYQQFDQAVYDEYTSGLRRIVSRIKQEVPQARITLIQPSPFDDVTRPPAFAGGYNAVLAKFGGFVRELAKQEGLSTADLNAPVVGALKRAHAADPEIAARLIPDRVHPGAAGHLLMAAELIKAWGGAREGQALVTTFADIGTFQPMPMLPLPIDWNDPAVALAVRSSDIERTLNTQLLRVSNVPAGTWELRIDGEPAGRFTAEQYAAGVNIATLRTPMWRQAMAVHALTLKHNQVRFARWRTLQVPTERDGWKGLRGALDALDALEAEIVAEQRRLAQPVFRTFELAPVQ